MLEKIKKLNGLELALNTCFQAVLFINYYFDVAV